MVLVGDALLAALALVAGVELLMGGAEGRLDLKMGAAGEGVLRGVLLFVGSEDGLLHLFEGELGEGVGFEESHQKNISMGIIELIMFKNSPYITQYEHLLKALARPKATHHLKITAVMLVYTCLSGVIEGLSAIEISWNNRTWQFVSEQLLMLLALLTVTYAALYLNRRKIILVLINLMGMGAALILLGVLLEVYTVGVVGVLIMGGLHYPLALLQVLIVLEYFTKKQYTIIWALALVGFTLGRVIAYPLYSLQTSELHGYWLKVLLPTMLLYVAGFFLSSESPRFLIDHNITEAETLLKSICESNQVRYEAIDALMERRFFWNRVGLRKYRIGTFWRYHSLSYQTYIMGICLLSLGIICRCPDFIQDQISAFSFHLDSDVSVLWVSTFELFSLLPAFIASRIMRRGGVHFALSIVLLLVSVMLAFFYALNIKLDVSPLYAMAIFGLNSFFAMALFYFLLLTAIEYYPITLRCFAVGILISCYSLGRLIFGVHTKFIGHSEFMLELVICCSFMLVGHCWAVVETKNWPGTYDVVEIEETETDNS